MSRNLFTHKIRDVVKEDLVFSLDKNFICLSKESEFLNQNSTNEAFSRKWADYDSSSEKEKCFEMQRKWYLDLYGFSSEKELASYLRTKEYIYDAGCGLGYKAAWFAALAPESIVIGMDFSIAAKRAADNYQDISNLFFVQGDIASPVFRDNVIDYVSCDQVIMHTEDPDKTFSELSRITKLDGEFACYFYAKKALPRELVDDFFRHHCNNMTHDELMEMSSQLSELGKRLSELNVSFDVPDIPALGIKGGTMDIQRFVYWNFLKCFWNSDLGRETSVMTNFDWYSPSNARRFSREEVENIVRANRMNIVTFHAEEACYSGRFSKKLV